MTLDALAKAIRNTIRDSAPIKAECTALFGKRHRIFYDPPESLSPAKDDCPVFIVKPAGKSIGETSSQRTFTIRVGCGILQEDPENEADDVEFTGAQRVESLLDLALSEIRLISSNISFDGIESDVSALEEFPILVGSMTLTITVPNLIGVQVTL